MRGRSILSLNHEHIPGVVVDKFYREAEGLFENAKKRFGVMAVADPRNGYTMQETTNPEAIHNIARYRAIGGEIVDIAKGDITLDGLALDQNTERLTAVIQTALESVPGLPNTFISETFSFDNHHDFTYELDAVDYTADGQRTIGDVDGQGLVSKIADLLKEDIGGDHETPEEAEVRKEVRAVIGRAKEPRLRALRDRFPEAMERFGVKCTDVHFNDVLGIIRGVKSRHEVGLDINPFARSDFSD